MGRQARRLTAAAVCLCAATSAVSAQASLVSPYRTDMTMRRVAAPVRTCPNPPPPMRDLKIESVFAGGDFKAAVPERVVRRRGLTRELHDYVGTVVDLSDRALLLKGQAKDAASDCVLDWLQAWLDHGALLGEVSYPEGEYEREWVSIALGLSLLKLYAGRPVEAPAWARDWYRDVSAGLPERYPLSAPNRNNHWYWAGLASVVAGTIAGDQWRYAWGVAQMRAGLADIDAKGLLTEELKRGPLALRYTAYAASALATIAAFEHANGSQMTASQAENLKRLVHSILSALADPKEFERRSGAPQERMDPASVRLLAWLEVYHDLTTDIAAEPWLRHLRPLKLMWLGGDVTMAFGSRIAPGAIAKSPLIER